MKRFFPLLLIVLGATIGAVIGHTQVLCQDGACAMTGSWYGGALTGGLLGLILGNLFVGSGCSGCQSGACDAHTAPEATPEPTDKEKDTA